ncbi:hypothetical protein [Mycoplana ramosa]|uniref:Lipoprotein n=1 Tax=Mycoplana ramosa TaxID=40837 RepID=A0ABW3YUX5_MYCRA
MHLRIIALALTAVLTSCAGVQVHRVTDRNQPGIRYWRPAPYLALVETRTENAVACEVRPLMLPDKTEEYAITINAGLGSVKATPTLTDGWNLVSLNAEADSKTSENLTALATLLKTGAEIKARGVTKPPTQPVPTCRGVFRVDYDAAGNFKGFSRISL